MRFYLAYSLTVFSQEVKEDYKIYHCTIDKTAIENVGNSFGTHIACYETYFKVNEDQNDGDYVLSVYVIVDPQHKNPMDGRINNITLGTVHKPFYRATVDNGEYVQADIEEDDGDIISAVSNRAIRITKINGFYRVLVLVYTGMDNHRIDFVYGKVAVKKASSKKISKNYSPKPVKYTDATLEPIIQ